MYEKSVTFPKRRTTRGLVSFPFLKPSKIFCKPTQGLLFAPVTLRLIEFLLSSDTYKTTASFFNVPSKLYAPGALLLLCAKPLRS